MPFGSDPFRDITPTEWATLFGPRSPMPFGSDPFRDKGPARKDTTGFVGHQCLSAVIPFGTTTTTMNTSFAAALVTNAFRQ